MQNLLFKTKKLLALTLVFASFSLFAQQNPLDYTPNDAQNIYVLNMSSIVKKMDIKAIQELDFFKKIIADGEKQGKTGESLNILKNPAESGIDFNKNIVFAMGAIEGTMHQMQTFIIPLSNKAKFDKLIGEITKSSIKKGANYNFLATDSTLTAWNESVIIYKNIKVAKMPDMSFNTEPDSTVASDDKEEKKENIAQYMPTHDKILTITANNDRVKALNNMLSSSHDIYIYQTSNGSSKNPMVGMAVGLLGFDKEQLEGNATQGWVDFENGRIYGETKQTLNEAFKAKLAEIVNTKPNVDWNRYIQLDSKNKPWLVMSLSLNTEGLLKMFEENPMLKGMAENTAKKSKKNVEFNKIMSELNGDIFITVGTSETGMDFLAGVSVKDVKKASQMLVKEMKAKEIAKNLYTLEAKKPVTDEEKEKQPFAKKPPMVLIKDKIIFIGNEEKIRKMAETPTIATVAASQPWQKAMQNKTFNMYMDLNTLMNFAPKKNEDNSKIMESMPFESMRMTSGGGTSEFEMKMADGEKNALYAFFTWIDKISTIKKEKTVTEQKD